MNGNSMSLSCVARYQHDFAGMPCRTLSQRYYYQALTLCPELGEQNSLQQCAVILITSCIIIILLEEMILEYLL